MDVDEGGVISPGGIGFDINCGMRLVRSDLHWDDVQPHLKRLVDRLFERVPAGVGSQGFIRLSRREFRRVLAEGARWCLEEGYAWPEDLERTEEGGCMPGADPDAVSERAVERGLSQIGTLGSGNHYLEIQIVRAEDIADPEAARRLGIDRPGQVVVMFHCGSRGFGHQVATDYLRVFLQVMDKRYGIRVVDRELAAAPFDSPEGQAYYRAMQCAINLSYANRQVILHRIREVFAEVFGADARALGLQQVYDVAHNTAKLETHEIGGVRRRLLVHRKGATRAFAPGMAGLPAGIEDLGQPVIIGGSMETGSYLLLGTPGGALTFFSTAHGSGRTMSRRQARRRWQGRTLQADRWRPAASTCGRPAGRGWPRRPAAPTRTSTRWCARPPKRASAGRWCASGRSATSRDEHTPDPDRRRPGQRQDHLAAAVAARRPRPPGGDRQRIRRGRARR
ncbi:MAG: hypothetical protein KatS3mg121_1345 [Gammaproteobacteria bacterium]|nr:MAG: hypothetical protein KatS3mg121_1345 [Gammaproteobacteria bacterium]